MENFKTMLELLEKDPNKNTIEFIKDDTTFKITKYSPNNYMLSRIIEVGDIKSKITENIIMFNPTLFKEEFLDIIIDNLI